MALQTSGTISLNDIAGEFGGSQPHELSSYYRAGGNVPDSSANSNIPTSGQISFSNFYGGANVTVLGDIGISSHTTLSSSNYNCSGGKTSNPMFGVCVAHGNTPAIGSFSDQTANGVTVTFWAGQFNSVTGSIPSICSSNSFTPLQNSTLTYPNGSTTINVTAAQDRQGGGIVIGPCEPSTNNTVRFGAVVGGFPTANGTYVFTR